MSSIMAQSFRRNVLSSRKVLFFQHSKRALGISNPYLFQTSHYANSTFPSPPQEASKYSENFRKEIAPAIFLKLALASIVGGITLSADLFHAWYQNRCNESLLNETLEKGNRPDVEIPKKKLASRPEIVEYLKKILLPNEDQSLYYVVCGEHGIGKTTLIKIASREVGQDNKRGIQGGRGVIYVEVPPDTPNIEKFGEAFGKALNFTFEENISFSTQLMKKLLGDTNKDSKDPKWLRALEAFKRASAVYKKNNPCHQPPVIVYDNISQLIHLDPKVLDFLQEDAKINADRQKYIAVFVCNEGSVPRRMESRSAWSRANKPVIEISDLSKEESIDYLVNKRKIKKEDAERLYEFVGGRIIDLKTVITKFVTEGMTIEDIKKQVLIAAEKTFQAAELLEKQTYHKVGKQIINSLLKSEELSLDYTEFRKFFNNLKESDEMLKKNVFAYHPGKNIVTFQSRSIECFVQENLKLFTTGISKFTF